MKQKAFKIIFFLTLLMAMDWLISLFFQKGLEHYYGLDQQADILLIGHSHLMKTCNKLKMEKALELKVSKYCREGVNIPQRHYMIQHYLDKRQNNSAPIVIYGVDPTMFGQENLSLNSYKLFYPFMDSPPMDNLIRKEASKWYDYHLHKWIRCSRYADVAIYRACRGWMNYWESLSNGVISLKDWNKKRSAVHVSDELLQEFKQTIDLLLKNNSHIILVYPGIIRGYRDGNPEKYDSVINIFQTMANESPHIDFLNYSSYFSPHREFFEDSVHINRKGEEIFTRLIVKDIETIIQKNKIQTSRSTPQQKENLTVSRF